YPRPLARIRRIGFESRYEQGWAGQTPAQYGPVPVQTCLLEFPRLSIGAQGMPSDQVRLRRDEVEKPLVPKPTRRLPVHFQDRRLEEENMAAVLQGSHVGIERLPVIADQRQPAGGSELLRHVAQLQDRCRGVPAQRLDRLTLAQGLQEPDAAAVSI